MTVLKHNNYSVDAVYDGAILDIMMPKMDSLTVLKTIRLHGNPVPVLLLTAKSVIDDCSIYQLSRKTDSIRLANKEYKMLEMLMINPGQIISTEQFMDKIWGYDSDAELNVVWVYISYLRKKLSSLDSTIQIKATRGLGYQVKRLASLTEKLVMLSRMDEENTTLERQNFCISDAVYDTVEIKSYRYTIQQMIFLLEIWTYCLNAFTGLMNLVILRREVLELDFLSL